MYVENENNFYYLDFFQKNDLSSKLESKERAKLLINIVDLMQSMEQMPFFMELITVIQPILIMNIDQCDKTDRQEMEASFNKLPEGEHKKMLMRKIDNSPE